MSTRYGVSKVSLAVTLAFISCGVSAQQDDVLDEVVTTGTRLQGSASAVIEERKNQAFVADILGAEQISRTGDSDAASALRRVTGLTLVDGKFIFVRGLGQRYSSARLNGASIPSPDLTRNVIPLDIFPSSVIESLSVQKVFSPNMPAAFGGGSVDIRTKSLPSEFVSGIQFGAELNSENSNGNTFNTGGNLGGIPQALSSAISQYQGDFSLRGIVNADRLVSNSTATAAQQAVTVNNDLLKSLPRDIGITQERLDPNYSVQGFIGNSIEEKLFDGQLGFLASLAYDNKWTYSDQTNGVLSSDFRDNCSIELLTDEDVLNPCFDSQSESQVTIQSERLNGLFTTGYRLGTHNVNYTKIYIEDNDERSDIVISQNPNQNISIAADQQADRRHGFRAEDRTLDIDQFTGQHTFLDFMGLGADWQYTQSKAETDIPLDVDFGFNDAYDLDGRYVSSSIDGGIGQVNYQFIDLEDNMKSWSGNLTLPISVKNFDVEFKGGWDFSDRARVYSTSSFFVNNTGAAIEVNRGIDSLLNVTQYLDDEIIENSLLLSFNEPEAPEADDYLAGQKIEAGYGAFDIFYKNFLRISGGLRYEAFKQVSISTSSLIFDRQDLENLFNVETIQNGTVSNDDFYPALSLTYIGGESYQLRFGYGETVVRPDLREVVPVGYLDPLTDIRTTGSTTLTSTTLKNYDFRYELYGQGGNNLAVSLFYKDITNPIETILSVGDANFSASFTNGDKAELYGIEAEWLYDLGAFMDGFFTSGNVTLSESEVDIDPVSAGNLTNTSKPLTGHSKYVANLQLNYDSANGEHSASVVYNVFGERILASGINGRDDAFEQPIHSLDAIYSYFPNFNSTVKFSLKNILGEDQTVTQNGFEIRTRTLGTTFKVNYQYDF